MSTYRIAIKSRAIPCRNIDKAGGLDRYVYKIRGTQEDTQKAEQLRKQIDEQETARRTYALRAEELRR